MFPGKVTLWLFAVIFCLGDDKGGFEGCLSPSEKFSQNVLLLLAVLSTLLLALTLTPTFTFSVLLFHQYEDIVQDPSLP